VVTNTTACRERSTFCSLSVLKPSPPPVCRLLTWWVDHDFRHGPTELAHMYQRLAAPGLLTALGHGDGLAFVHEGTAAPAS
jgi:hypothetical protein